MKITPLETCELNSLFILLGLPGKLPRIGYFTYLKRAEGVFFLRLRRIIDAVRTYFYQFSKFSTIVSVSLIF